MLETADGSHYSGKFQIDGKDLDGELTFAGPESGLFVHHPTFFRPDAIEDRCVHGMLRDLTRVSLMKCLAPPLPASSWSQALGGYESANIRPHFILHGSQYLAPKEKRVKAVHFVLKDAPFIFQDYDAFSSVWNVKPAELRALVKEKEKLIKRRVKIGTNPAILYFTGKYQIFRAKTVLGTIAAEHLPSFNAGGSNGVWVKNSVGTNIKFQRPLTFDDALGALWIVMAFFDIIAGRRQELVSLNIELNGKGRSSLGVYICNPLNRVETGGRDLHIIDLPIDAVREPEAFGAVLANWLTRHNEWKTARNRFSASFAKENSFDVDRLIGSANMFDLLPPSAVPKKVPLTKELREARDASRELFKQLPESVERDSVLNALGRVGHATLKRKVRHRAVPVIELMGDKLPELADVLDIAVDARNHFVHGTESKIDYADYFFQTVPFFSQALEFVFVTSDLLEAGWDLRRWREKGTTLSHPIASFLYNYEAYLEQLREVLPVGHKLKGKY